MAVISVTNFNLNEFYTDDNIVYGWMRENIKKKSELFMNVEWKDESKIKFTDNRYYLVVF